MSICADCGRRCYYTAKRCRDCSYVALRKSFWDQVDKRGADECWEWRGGRGRRGYGRWRPRKTTTFAHRRAWELTHGPIPEGLIVCHRCDNPPCCNPAHLFVGTQADNMADMHGKGRAAIGERLPQAKLTTRTAKQVRDLCDAGWRQRDVAAAYGITQSSVSDIARRKSWVSVPIIKRTR